MAKRGRPAGTYTYKKYDLYEVKENGKEVFVCRADKPTLHEKYGISVNNIAADIKAQRIKRGYQNKKYKAYFEGAKDAVEVAKAKLSSMPQHVSEIRLAGAMRFGG